MAYRIVFIPADSEKPVEIQTANRKPTYTQLSKFVGGYIERVPLFDTWKTRKCDAWCNEEGKLRNLPLNERATMAWWLTVGQVTYPLVGDTVIVAKVKS